MSKLTQLRKTLTIVESCKYLEERLKEPLSLADIFRLVLEGHLNISLKLDKSTYCLNGGLTKDKYETGCFIVHGFDISIKFAAEPELEIGLLQLSMFGSEVDILKDQFKKNSKSKTVDSNLIDWSSGVTLKRNDNHILLLECYENNPNLEGSEAWMFKDMDDVVDFPQSYIDEEKKAQAEARSRFLENNPHFFVGETIFVPSKAFPSHAELVFEKTELDRFVDSLIDIDKTKSDKKTITATERNTLLTLIAALCKEQGIDWEAKGMASVIELMTEALGAPVSDDTIRRVLKQIPDAVEARKK